MKTQMKTSGGDRWVHITHRVIAAGVSRSIRAIALTGLLCVAAPLLAQKKVIIPKGAARSSAPFSPAIQTRNLTYVAGMVGRAPDGSVAKGEIRAQTRQTLANIGMALDAAGLGFQHVVSTNVYLADIRHLDIVDEVYREYFPQDFPARTVLESMLMGPDFIVEISSIAVNDLAEKTVIAPPGWQSRSVPLAMPCGRGTRCFFLRSNRRTRRRDRSGS